MERENPDRPNEAAAPATEPVHFLVGVTAAGKTELALEIAEALDATVLSMDSMLVYRGMDVGTAKPTAAERARVPHELIDLVDPSERYDVQRYLADFDAALERTQRAGRRALVVGGTGFYLQALVHGVFAGPAVDPAVRRRWAERGEQEGAAALHAELIAVDPESARRIHPNDAKRVRRALEVWDQTGRTLTDWQSDCAWNQTGGRPRRIVGLACPEPELTDRIQRRTRQLLDDGWVEEVRALEERGGLGETACQALGYREVRELAEGRAERDATLELVALRTRQFARRQRTWFRRFPETTWIERGAPDRLRRALNALGWSPDSDGAES